MADILGNLTSNLLGGVVKNIPGVSLINDLTGGFIDNTINKTVGTIGDQLSGGKNKDKTGDGFEKNVNDAVANVLADAAQGKKVDAGKVAGDIVTNVAVNTIGEKYGKDNAEIAGAIIDTAKTGKVDVADAGKTIISNSNLNDGQKALANTVVDVLKSAHDSNKAKKKEVEETKTNANQEKVSDNKQKEPAKEVKIDVVDKNGNKTTQTVENKVTAAQIDKNGDVNLTYADGTTVNDGKASITANPDGVKTSPDYDAYLNSRLEKVNNLPENITPEELIASGYNIRGEEGAAIYDKFGKEFYNKAVEAEDKVIEESNQVNVVPKHADNAEAIAANEEPLIADNTEGRAALNTEPPKVNQEQEEIIEDKELKVYQDFNKQWDDFNAKAKKEAEEQGLTGTDAGIYVQRQREHAFINGELETLEQLKEKAGIENKKEDEK